MKSLCLLFNMRQGIFGGELAVEVQTFDKAVSFFVAESRVQRHDTHSWVEVELLDRNDKHCLVKLPEAPINGSQVVKVSLNHLRETRDSRTPSATGRARDDAICNGPVDSDEDEC